MNDEIEQFWSYWSKFHIWFEEQHRNEEGSFKEKKSHSDWTKNIITDFVKDISKKLNLIFKDEQKAELDGRKKKDYVLYKDESLNKQIFYIEHENLLTEIYGEFNKLFASNAINNIIISYGKRETVAFHLSNIIRPSMEKLLTKKPEKKWLFIFGTGNKENWLPDPIDEWSSYIAFIENNQFYFKILEKHNNMLELQD